MTTQDRQPPSRVDTAREAVTSAYATARETTSRAAHRATEELSENPLPALLGGLALGAVVGALLPRTEREEALLGTFGSRIGGAATAALEAAKQTGGDGLRDIRLDADTAGDQVSRFVGQVAKAAGEAGLAAFRDKH